MKYTLVPSCLITSNAVGGVLCVCEAMFLRDHPVVVTFSMISLINQQVRLKFISTLLARN